MSQLPTPNQGNRSLAQLIANLGQQSPVVETSKADPRSLAAGIKPSFASINFKGKTWGIRHRGTTEQLLGQMPNGQKFAIPTIDVVIVKSASAISKTYYIEKFKDDSFKQPDCWSTNGLKPDPAAPKKQNETCRGCRWDAFGSRTMDDGRKGKACSDNKRTAVVPALDLKNERYGGPMLLRLPPSAFNALSELETQLHMQGYRYYGIVMQLSFDTEAAFPKIIFTPTRVLNDHEAQEVIALQDNELVDRILNEEATEVTGDPDQPVEQPTPTNVHPLRAQPIAPSPATAFSATPPPAAQAPATGVSAGAFGGAQIGVQITEENLEKARAMVREQPMTAEQQEIARLKAELAAAQQPKPRRKRSAPVTPNGGQPQVTVQAAEQEPETDDEDGEEPGDLQGRIDQLLKPSGGSSAT